jgi:hypothetical protein
VTPTQSIESPVCHLFQDVAKRRLASCASRADFYTRVVVRPDAQPSRRNRRTRVLLRGRLADVTPRLGERPDPVGAELAAEARLSDAAERHPRVLGRHAVAVDADRARDELPR